MQVTPACQGRPYPIRPEPPRQHHVTLRASRRLAGTLPDSGAESAGEVEAHHRREVVLLTTLPTTGAHAPIGRDQADRRHADEDLARRRYGVGDICHPPAVTDPVDDEGAHLRVRTVRASSR